MKALSIRQPWAWLIIHGGKDIENRSWSTKFRGRFFVHAAKGMTKAEYEFACDFAAKNGVKVPPAEDLQRGGIIGTVELVGSLNHHTSPWYMGQQALILKRPEPLQFTPLKGRLGFFEVDCNLIQMERPVYELSRNF